MRLGFGLEMQQTQRLVMTPELRQAITVLQLPVAELGEYIEQELLENPCLDAEPKEETEEPVATSEAERLMEYLGRGESGGEAPSDGDEESSFEAFTALLPTLPEHLRAQLLLLGLEPLERRTGEFLIDSLDDHGYLSISTTEGAAALQVLEETVLRVLTLIQGFDPPGVGARSLKECLLLQWATVDDGNPLVEPLIADYLDDLGEGRITYIAESLGATPVEVQEAADLVRTLDPKPGRRFGRGSETRYILPDATVERVGGEYVVLVNEGTLPKLTINSQYRQILGGEAGEAHARKYVEERIHAAMWLLKAIEQRRMTLYKVTEAIVAFQKPFLDQGVRHLRPLTLREVAEVVGVHESTVSRATAGKYLQTPRGTFDFKFFFSSGVDNARGEGMAAESVKRIMADLISKEDAREPLSDQALTDAMKKQGLNISRRTVAKYREEMGVASSGKRKRY